ncbi:type II and III secretion system protein family protein, partial [Rhizobium ruizarguesonis]
RLIERTVEVLTRACGPHDVRRDNDVELLALGVLEVDKDMIRRFRNGEGVTGPYGHRLDLNQGGQVVDTKS